MSLTLQDQIKAKRRAANAVRVMAFGSQAQQVLSALFQEISQKLGTGLQLQVVEVDLQTSSGADVVVADTPCKLYGAFFRKANATAAWLKGSDSASAASATAGEATHKFAAASTDFVVGFYPTGFAQANGWTVRVDTTAAGNTRSTTGDGPKGFYILGAA